MSIRKSQGNKTNIEDEKRKEEKKHEQGRTLSRQNFHSNQNELRRDHKSHKGKFNETTTGYKSLWCFGPYGPPACIIYILDGSETRLLRIVVVAEGRSTSIDFTGRWNQAKKLAVRSVSEQYWSSAVSIRCPWFYEGVGKYPKKKKKKGKSWYTTYYKLLIYDWLLRQTRSMPRGCLPLFVSSFFVSCWWPWKTFHRSRFFFNGTKEW